MIPVGGPWPAVPDASPPPTRFFGTGRRDTAGAAAANFKAVPEGHGDHGAIARGLPRKGRMVTG